MAKYDIDFIFRDGKRYDQFGLMKAKDIPFWLGMAETYGPRVLEIGVGTGRVAVALAKHGNAVTGIDVCPDMLAEAERKADADGVRLDLSVADMIHFDLAQTFDTVIMPHNVLCHLYEVEDFVSCMAAVRKHLAPDGRLIVDMFVPAPELLVAAEAAELIPFASHRVNRDGKEQQLVQNYAYHSDTQIREVSIFDAEHTTQSLGKLHMRMFFPQELIALMQLSGFVVEHRFSSYERDAFNSASNKQILVCRRT